MNHDDDSKVLFVATIYLVQASIGMASEQHLRYVIGGQQQ